MQIDYIFSCKYIYVVVGCMVIFICWCDMHICGDVLCGMFEYTYIIIFDKFVGVVVIVFTTCSREFVLMNYRRLGNVF